MSLSFVQSQVKFSEGPNSRNIDRPHCGAQRHVCKSAFFPGQIGAVDSTK